MTTKFKTVEEAVKAAYEALAEAEQLADETGKGFRFSPEYGIGGYYDPEDENENTGTNRHPSSLSC